MSGSPRRDEMSKTSSMARASASCRMKKQGTREFKDTEFQKLFTDVEQRLLVGIEHMLDQKLHVQVAQIHRLIMLESQIASKPILEGEQGELSRVHSGDELSKIRELHQSLSEVLEELSAKGSKGAKEDTSSEFEHQTQFDLVPTNVSPSDLTPANDPVIELDEREVVELGVGNERRGSLDSQMEICGRGSIATNTRGSLATRGSTLTIGTGSGRGSLGSLKSAPHVATRGSTQSFVSHKSVFNGCTNTASTNRTFSAALTLQMNGRATMDNKLSEEFIIVRPKNRPSKVLGEKRRSMLRPFQMDSPLSVGLTVASVTALIFDLWYIPAMLSFNLEWPIATWCLAIFWTVELLSNFIINNSSESRGFDITFKEVAHRYLQRSFIFDAAFVACDWSWIIMSATDLAVGSTQTVRVMRLLKVTRFLRFARTIRFLRFFTILDLFLWAADQAQMKLHLQLTSTATKLSLAFMWAMHCFACAWYAFVKNAGSQWHEEVVKANGGFELSEPSWYVAGMHWAVTTVVSGASSIAATSNSTQIYTSIMVVLGLLLSSIMVSVLTSTVVDFLNHKIEFKEQMQGLKIFMRQHNVPRSTQYRILAQVSEREATQAICLFKNVLLFERLSLSVKEQLSADLCTPHLKSLQFFSVVHCVDNMLLYNLAASAIDFEGMIAGEFLFTASLETEASFVLTLGTLEYTSFYREEPFEVKATSQISEMTLFVQVWRTRGILQSSGVCELLEINASEFWNVVEQFQGVRRIVVAYARELLVLIRLLNPQNLDDLTTGIDHDHVAVSLPSKFMYEACQPAAQCLGLDLTRKGEPETTVASWMSALGATTHSWSRRGRRKSLVELEADVMTGKCSLSFKNGVCARVVHVVVIDLRREDGRHCKQLGKWDEDSEEVDIRLPATQTRTGENAHRALDRFLQSDLAGISDAMVFRKVEVEISTESESHHMPTKHIRTVFSFTCAIASIDNSINGTYHELSLDSQSSTPVSTFVCQNPEQHDTNELFAWFDDTDWANVNPDTHVVQQWLKSWRLERESRQVTDEEVPELALSSQMEWQVTDEEVQEEALSSQMELQIAECVENNGLASGSLASPMGSASGSLASRMGSVDVEETRRASTLSI